MGELENFKLGEAKGIIETALDYGVSETMVLGRLQSKLGITLQEAEEYFGQFGRRVSPGELVVDEALTQTMMGIRQAAMDSRAYDRGYEQLYARTSIRIAMAQGASESEILERLQSELGISPQDAQMYLEDFILAAARN